jgi:hypothetical protein
MISGVGGDRNQPANQLTRDVPLDEFTSRVLASCPLETVRSSARWLEVTADGEHLIGRPLHPADAAAPIDIDLVGKKGRRPADARIAFQTRSAVNAAAAPSLTCVMGLQRAVGAALEAALQCLALTMSDWMVVVLATRPSISRDTPHRTVLHADGWAELLASAGWSEVQREPLALNASHTGNLGVVPAGWKVFDPFKDGSAGGEWLLVLRRQDSPRRRDSAGFHTKIANALRRFRLSASNADAPEAHPSSSRLGFVIGGPQDYYQLLPLIDALPAAQRVVMVRQGLGAPAAQARRSAIVARLEARGYGPIQITDLSQIPWDGLGALLTAAESTANSDHLLNATFVIAARTRGIDTFQLQHGIVPLKDYARPAICFARHYLAWGADVRRVLAISDAERAERRRVFHAVDRMGYAVTGCPKFDAYARSTPVRATELFGRWVTRFERMVLVATNLHWPQHQTGEDVWSTVRDIVAQRPNDLFVLKLHPAEEAPADLAAGLPENLVVIDEFSALDAGLDSTRLVLASEAIVCTLSTIALEAALAERPFLVLDTGNPNRYRGVRQVALPQLPQALSAVLKRPPNRRAFVDAYIESSTVGSATQRVMDVVTRASRRRSRRAPSGPTWRAFEALGETLVGREGHAAALEAAVIEKDIYNESLRDAHERAVQSAARHRASGQEKDRRIASLEERLACPVQPTALAVS